MPTTFFGIIIGIGLMGYAIIGVSNQDPDSVKTVTDMYLQLPSFLLVFGGTIAATLIAHPFSHLIRGIKAFFIVFFRTEFSWVKVIDEICRISEIYTQKGVQGMEEVKGQLKKETIIQEGLTMLVNGYKYDEIIDFLDINVARRYDRDMIDFYVFSTMGKTAPAFGMVGTLVGLIYMLRVMGDSPDKIGPFLALALVTTFYGLLLANLIFNPMGNKVLHHAAINLRIGKMEIEGIKYILQKQHPIYIKDQLSSYIPPPELKKLYKAEKKLEKGK